VRQGTIQFESVVEDGIIRIPEQYVEDVPSLVRVTLVPADKAHVRARTKEGPFTSDDFIALKIDTRGWKFDREEANERR
jgi:hypothetical protein